jgi:epsilon-lactone hydrolase
MMDHVKGIPEKQKEHCTVKGLFLHQDDTPTEHLIFWVYGGAYLGGDVEGNSSAADWVAQQCRCDVFIPDFRLAPEADADDVMWDVLLAYSYICKRIDPSKIYLLGISSGGAICVRLMQFIAEFQRKEKLLQPYMSKILDDPNMKMPKGAILFGPYVDYTAEKKGSFLHYPRHDLVVTEAVQDYCLPYLDGFIPEGKRREYSPVYRSMEGLPPMCVTVSEHESVYDMTIELVNKARAQGVPVTVGVWKYMCHVFSFLLAFVPEGRLSMEFVCDWIRQQSEKD